MSFAQAPRLPPIDEHPLLCAFNTYAISIEMLTTYTLPLSNVKINLDNIDPDERHKLLLLIKLSCKATLRYLIAVAFNQADFPETMPTDFPYLVSISLSRCDINFGLLSEFQNLRFVKIQYPPVEFYNVANPKIEIPAMTSLSLFLTVGNILPTDVANLCIGIASVKNLEIEVPLKMQNGEDRNEPNLSKFVKQLNEQNVPELRHLILSGFGPDYHPSLINDFIHTLCTYRIELVDVHLSKWNERQRTTLKQLIVGRGGNIMFLGNNAYRVTC